MRYVAWWLVTRPNVTDYQIKDDGMFTIYYSDREKLCLTFSGNGSGFNDCDCHYFQGLLCEFSNQLDYQVKNMQFAIVGSIIQFVEYNSFIQKESKELTVC